MPTVNENSFRGKIQAVLQIHQMKIHSTDIPPTVRKQHYNYLVTKIRQPFFTGSSIYSTKTRGGCISNNSPQRAGSFSDSAVSRALEEALRTTAIVSWDAAGDCIEEVSPVMTSRASLGSNFEFQQGSLSRSSPSTTNSSPKGGGRPRGKQYSNFRCTSFENVQVYERVFFRST